MEGEDASDDDEDANLFDDEEDDKLIAETKKRHLKSIGVNYKATKGASAPAPKASRGLLSCDPSGRCNRYFSATILFASAFSSSLSFSSARLYGVR